MLRCPIRDPGRVRCASAALLALLGLACVGTPQPVGRGAYVVKRMGRIGSPSREVATSAASRFCDARGQRMRPDFVQTESGAWGEPITEVTFRCLPSRGSPAR